MNDAPLGATTRAGVCKIEVEIPEVNAVAMQQIVDPCSPILEYKNLSELVSAVLQESPLLAFLTDFRRVLSELRMASGSASKEKDANDKVPRSSSAHQLPLDPWCEQMQGLPSGEDRGCRPEGGERPQARIQRAEDEWHAEPVDDGQELDGRGHVQDGHEVAHDSHDLLHDDIESGVALRGPQEADVAAPQKTGFSVRTHEIGRRCAQVAAVIERCLRRDDIGQ